MNWILDPDVQFWANQTMPDLGMVPTPQYPGRPINLAVWAAAGWLTPPVPILPAPVISSPANIIDCFTAHNWLAGVSLVVSWGTMWRRKNDIIGAGLNVIDTDVDVASTQITGSAPLLANRSINASWATLTAGAGLNWSSVMTSKTLHFMARSLGVTDDCPVPLDNEVTLSRLWVGFKTQVAGLRQLGIAGPPLPSIRTPRCFTAYNRYMTAILVWKNRKNVPQAAAGGGGLWTTTDVEATIFGLNPIHWI